MRRILSLKIVFSCRKAKRLARAGVCWQRSIFSIKKLTKKEKTAIFFINTTLNLN